MKLRRTRDPVEELAKVNRKVSDYYKKHPGADRLPNRLARELAERTRAYAEYLERRK